MALYQYDESVGDWVLCQRPYVKYNNVWTACRTAWVKRGGVWVRAWSYDTTPPDPPLVDLILHEDFDMVQGRQVLKSRWIRVGVRMPQPAHDPDIQHIRVLTDFNDKPPTTPFGSTYTPTADSTYPAEPWSEWRYGPAEEHHDTSNLVYKQWPRDAKDGTQLKGDRTYHFGAWAVDAYGNWSGATQHKLTIPKGGVDEPTVHLKETTFLPNSTGSWKKNAWEAGHLLQQQTPRSMGLMFYGGQFKDNFSANSTIKTAQIYLYRTTAGSNAVANVWLFWNSVHNPTNLPPTGGVLPVNQVQYVGQIAKGQGRWFNIPQQHYSEIKNGNLKCFGLFWKNPDAAGAAASDWSQIAGGNYGGSGNVHMVWEQPV